MTTVALLSSSEIETLGSFVSITIVTDSSLSHTMSSVIERDVHMVDGDSAVNDTLLIREP